MPAGLEDKVFFHLPNIWSRSANRVKSKFKHHSPFEERYNALVSAYSPPPNSMRNLVSGALHFDAFSPKPAKATVYNAVNDVQSRLGYSF